MRRVYGRRGRRFRCFLRGSGLIFAALGAGDGRSPPAGGVGQRRGWRRKNVKFSKILKSCQIVRNGVRKVFRGRGRCFRCFLRGSGLCLVVLDARPRAFPVVGRLVSWARDAKKFDILENLNNCFKRRKRCIFRLGKVFWMFLRVFCATGWVNLN